MQSSRPLVFATLAFTLLATAKVRSGPPPNGPSPDPFVKVDDSPTTDAGGKRPKPAPLSAVFVQEVYALKKEDAASVLEDTAAGAERYQRVLAFERENRARLLTLTALTNKSGDKATIESVEYVRYASAFRAPTDAMPQGRVLPTNFESRNAGDVWEMDPAVPDGGGTGTIIFQVTHVGLLGFTPCPSWPGDPVVEQPRFTAQSLSTETAFRLDEPVFLGTFTPPDGGGFLKGEGAQEILLAFLRVHVVPLETAAAKAPVPQGLNAQYSVYSMDRRLAREVVNAGPGAEAPWEKLQGALQDKRAKFEHVFVIAGKSGQKSAGQEGDEVIYGTRFSPPQHSYPAGPGADKQSAPVVTYPGTTEEVEKRSAGLSVELEPVLSPDGAAVDLNHLLSAITYLGNLDAKTLPAQPLFECRKFVSSLTIGMGKHVLAGTFNPPSPDGVNGRNKDDGRATLMFVRVTSAP